MKFNQVKVLVAILIAAVFAMSSHAGDRRSYPGGKFIGLSDHLVLGDVRLVGLEKACVKAFNRKTRVCTSEEIIKAAPLKKPIPDDGAWVYLQQLTRPRT